MSHLEHFPPCTNTDWRRAFDDAVRSWPSIALAFEPFTQHLQTVDAPADLGIRGPEIFLAVACARGDATAIGLFESLYLAAIPRHVGKLALGARQTDELTQILRIKLLSGPRPRIATYAGRAPLDAWVRVAAIRAALDLLSDEKNRADAHQPSIAALMMADADPEMLASRNDVRENFQTALDASLLGLTPREQLLLRMQVVDGLGLDELARVFRVHRATVARWLVSARTTVFDGVRARLGLRRRPTSSEFRSLVRLVKDDLHISVERILPASPADR